MTPRFVARDEAIWIAVLGILWVLYATPVQIHPSHFVHDDSYFYIQIADNIVDGHGSTFHRITPTNGYHQLWMLFCVAAMAVSGGSKEVGLHVVAGLQALLFVGVALCFRGTVNRLGVRFGMPGIALLAGFFLSTALYGSEAHLNAFFLALGLYLMVAALRDPDKTLAWAGIALGLSILARLDNVFVVGALGLGAVLGPGTRAPRDLLARAAAIFAPVVVIVGSYLAFNLATTGHLVPISGAIKSTFPEVVGRIENLGGLGKLVSVFAVVSVISSFSIEHRPFPRLVLRSLGAGVLLHSTYVVLFTNHYTFWTWYYVAGVLNLALLSCVTAEYVARRIKARRVGDVLVYALTACILVAGLGYGWAKALNPSRLGPFELPRKISACRWPDALGSWMQLHLPPDSGVLVYDWPGALAFYSDLRIFPADGLINDFNYNDELPRVGAGEFLCRHEVDYYFGRRPTGPGPVGPQQELRVRRIDDDGHELELYTPLGHRPAGQIFVLDKNLVIRVPEVVDCPEESPDAAIWRLDTCTH